MYRFFAGPDRINEEKGLIRISGEDVNHIRNVLRLKDREQLLLCSGRAEDPYEYLCEIDYSCPESDEDLQTIVQNVQTDAQTNTQMNTQTDAQTNPQTNVQMNLQSDAAGKPAESAEGRKKKKDARSVSREKGRDRERGRRQGHAGGSQETIAARILEKRICRSELPAKLILFQGLPKADKMEPIILRSVELGVFQIVPVLMKRTIVRLDDRKAERRTERWNAISLSAAKQSKRGIIPRVNEPADWQEALNLAESCDHIIVPYENADGISYTRQVIGAVAPGQIAAVFIGPEGGFEEEEIQDLKEAGAKIISLGHRILRTETAGPAVLAALMLHLEE